MRAKLIETALRLAKQNCMRRSTLLRTTSIAIHRSSHAHVNNLPSLAAIKMRPAVQAATSAARQWTRHTLPKPSTASRLAAPSLTASQSEPQRRLASTTTAGETSTSSFDSPFGKSKDSATDFDKIPNFKAYMSKRGEGTNRVFQYFMVGSMGLLSAAGAKATVQGTSDYLRALRLRLGRASWRKTIKSEA